MRKLLGNLVVVVLIVVAIGYFRGWFTVSREDEAGKTNVEVQIDKDKVKDDADEVARKARELRNEVEHVIHDEKVDDESDVDTDQP